MNLSVQAAKSGSASGKWDHTDGPWAAIVLFLSGFRMELQVRCRLERKMSSDGDSQGGHATYYLTMQNSTERSI